MSADGEELHDIRWCCGTTCDATANWEYVKKLESRLVDAEQRIVTLRKQIHGIKDNDPDD